MRCMRIVPTVRMGPVRRVGPMRRMRPVLRKDILRQGHSKQNHHGADSQNLVSRNISLLVRKEVLNSSSYFWEHLIVFILFICHFHQLLTILSRVPFCHVVV